MIRIYYCIGVDSVSDEKPKKIQDIITYDQKLFSIVDDEERRDILYDPTYHILISSIKYTPFTVEEIVQKYEEAKKPKSLMTVYRYIRKLTEAGFITEAGKRIITYEDNRNKTVTLYLAAAKIFYDNTYDQLKDDIGGIRKKECEIYSLLLKNLTTIELKDMECINQIINSIYSYGLNNMSEIMSQHEQDLDKYLSDFGTMMTNTLIVHIGWISAIINEEMREKILKCLK